MSFEDKLRSALDMAVKHYNDGCTPDEACCKTACDCGFNRDQADRLVEVMNTAITINQYKQAEDRTADFPIAHKDKVAAMMLDADTVLGTGKKSEKKANVYFEYMSPASRIRGQASAIEKAASAEKSNVYEKMSDENVAHLAMREITMKKSAAAYAKDVAGYVHGQLVTDLYSLADDIKKAGTGDYAVFKSACDSKDIVERLDRVLPDAFSAIEPAPGFVDDTKVAGFVDRADRMHESYEFMKEMRRQEKELSKQAHDMRAELVRACGLEDGGMDKSALVTGLLKIPYDRSKLLVSSMVKDLDKKTDSSGSDSSDAAENVRRAMMLQYLLATDDVLKDMDRNTVLSGYNTLLSVAPKVANDMELVRAILRQTAQSTAISPFDAEQWAKLDQRMNDKNVVA